MPTVLRDMYEWLLHGVCPPCFFWLLLITHLEIL
jgi:hypothetical protein